MTAVLESPASVESVEVGSRSVAQVVNMMKAAALFTALSDALLFTAHPSARLPMLEAVRLEFGAGQLVAVATDRFVLGVSRLDYAGASFTMLLTGGDAKALVKMAKTVRRDASSREVSIEVDNVGAHGGEHRDVSFQYRRGDDRARRGRGVPEVAAPAAGG